MNLALRVLCPREDASTLPEDRQNLRSGFLCERTRFFMLRRGVLRRSLDDLLLVTQRLLREASCIGLQVPSVDHVFMHSALHLQNVLRSEQYSHLQNMPVEMAIEFILQRRDGFESFSEVIIQDQESIEYPDDFRAVPASQEALNALEKRKPDGGLQENGGAGEPCVICLEYMNLPEVEVACMPCNHNFHHDCIVRWLKTSNLCPLCRFAFPTGLSDVD